MTSALYLEHYLDSTYFPSLCAVIKIYILTYWCLGLENLPVELQRNFTLMRDLDSRAQELMRNIDKLADDYMSNIKAYSADKRNETMTSIQRQFDKAKEYGDDKVQLAIQTYELVSSNRWK